MPSKTKLHPAETRKPAPQALEFLIAKAAVAWEKACRQVDGVTTMEARDRHAKAHKKLRRLASQLIPEKA